MLEFIRDIYTSFRQTSLERVKSPYLGAFVFSWIAFNWPMIAVLFFSKKDIELRIEYINNHFDIGDYLLGPIFTSALIAFLLPQVNKLITKIQDKPTSDTIELTLSSKIRVAELQQSIAEIEAKKKLADKKEEKYIEESIYAIKEENKKLHEASHAQKGFIRDLEIKLNDSQLNANKIKSQLETETDKLQTAQNNIKILENNVLNLSENSKTLVQEHVRIEAELNLTLRDKEKLAKENIKINEIMDNLTKNISKIAESYPAIFTSNVIEGAPYLKVSPDAINILPDLNAQVARNIISNSIKEQLNENFPINNSRNFPSQ